MNILRVIFFLIILFPLSLGAQNEKIQQLEAEVQSLSGAKRIQKTILLSDAYASAGNYQKALDWAEDAEAFAKRLNEPELKAIALNREGKALVVVGKKGIFGKNPAVSKFVKSNEILQQINGDKKTILDNLNQLRLIAVAAGRADEIASIDAQISQLSPSSAPRNNNPTVTAASSGNPGSETPEQWLKESQELQALLAEKEAAISQMSELQVKNQLIMMQQRSMLDSLRFRANLDSLKVSNWNLKLKEAESSRNFNYAIMVLLILVAGGSTYSYFKARQNARVLEEKNKIIRAEQQRSEELLLNILPSLVADELKLRGHTIARYFEDVSVLFADFVGFSKIAETQNPQQLVTELDTCFKAFDQIMAKYQLEKIKTIGDAYMCAGGISGGKGSQLYDIIQAAREMQAWLSGWNAERKRQGLPVYEARIGIHRGPVVAGVVGSKKFAFDIWGDTVNIAARIEQAGESGKINISGDVYKNAQEFFTCKHRGKIAVKHAREIEMYFVEN